MFRKPNRSIRIATGSDQPRVGAAAGQIRDRWRAFHEDHVIHQPKLPLFSASDTVLTMGSCFANELRAFLRRRELGVLYPNVPVEVHDLIHPHSHEVSSWGPWNGESNLQWYNTFTLRQEVERATGVWQPSTDDVWTVTMGREVLYQCPYRRRMFARSPEDLAAVTAAIDQDIRTGMADADLIILTLGLTEVWRKVDNGRISCAEPGYCSGGGKTETTFHASTFAENLDNIRTAVLLLNEHFGRKQLVVTTSPVPLGRTFRPLDVAVANMESKSILRAVAGAVAAEFDNVTYFPSYELCATDPSAFRLDDGRHVRPEKVDQIMSLFVASHLAP